MADYPKEVQLFRLIGRLGRGMGDTIDLGGDADLAPLKGARIICTPDLKAGDGGPVFKSLSSSPPVTVFQESVLGTTNADGDLVAALLDDDGKTFAPVDPSQVGISLPFGGSPTIKPTGWTWTITISVGGNFPDRVFSVYGSAGGTVDVTTLVPVPADPGASVADWQAVVVTAQAAAKQAGDFANAANNSLQATPSGVAVVGDNLVFTRKDGSKLDVGTVRGAKGDKGDKGVKGDTGLPGTNGVATDTATASNMLTDGTQTKAALLQLISALAPAPLPPARTPNSATAIACWGDSITESGNGADSYSDLLARLTGLPVYNGGKWGQSSPQIGARQGGAPALLTFPGNTIPADTGATTVTWNVNALGGSYSGSRLGSAHGVLGTLAWDQASNTQTFTRTTAGSTVALTGPVKFVPADGANVVNREAVQILWAGRNGAQDVAGNLAAVKAMAGYGNARFLVLSVLPWSGQVSPDATNYAYQEAFPEQYRDIGAWLRTPAAATAAGITFTTDDQADITAGLTPRSLRQDDVHPNAAGRTAIAAYLFAELQKLGWVASYAAPSLPVVPTNRWDLSGRAAGQPIATVLPMAGTAQLTQSTVSAQPVGVADPLFKRNPASTTSTLKISAALAAVPSVATVTTIGRLTDAVDANGKLFVNLLGVLLRVNGAKYGTYATSGGAAFTGSATADAAPHVFTLVLNGAASTLWVDGVNIGTGTAAPSSTQLTLGGGAGFEVLDLVYNDSVLPDASIVATAAALRSGYIK